MPQAAAVFAQLEAAISRVHEIVAIGDALSAHSRERNRGTAIVHRGRRQQRGDRHAAVSGVQMQLVAEDKASS